MRILSLDYSGLPIEELTFRRLYKAIIKEELNSIIYLTNVSISSSA